MSELCISTVVSGDDFQSYIPTFIYTAKKAYPEYYVKVFLKGILTDHIREILEDMKKLRYCDIAWEVKENCFKKIKDRVSTCNTLRHLLPEEEFKDFKYLYITDIDFIIFRHNPTLMSYMTRKLKDTKLPYAACRGPYNYPKRNHINGIGWKGIYTRIADGMLILKTKEWFAITRNARKKYMKHMIDGTPDGMDNHPSASYREYNEVMLYRICSISKLKTPAKKNKYTDGTGLKRLYRDIHLGDFKFKERNTVYKWVKPENFFNFDNLQQDQTWQTITAKLDGTMAMRAIKKAAEYIRRFHNEADKRYTGKKCRKIPPPPAPVPEKTIERMESKTDTGQPDRQLGTDCETDNNKCEPSS